MPCLLETPASWCSEVQGSEVQGSGFKVQGAGFSATAVRRLGQVE
jgi:hypothetical protein